MKLTPSRKPTTSHFFFNFPTSGPFKFRLTDPHTLDESRKILIAGSLSNQEQAITTINQLSSLVHKFQFFCF